MQVGTFIRNLANQQTMTLAQRLRGANETTVITGLFREEGVATVRTNTSPSIVVGDFIKVTGSNFESFNTASSLVTSVIDDEAAGNFQVSYLSEGEDFVRLSITSKSFTDNVATLTVTPNSIFTANTSVVVAGIGALFDGTHSLTSSVDETITYAKVVTPTVITKASRVDNVATITTNTSLGILVGDAISISSEIGKNFNTTSVVALSVIDNTTNNTYQIRYTNDFPNFGKYTIIGKFLSNNVATLSTAEDAPFGNNANNIARLNSNGTIDEIFAGKIGSGAVATSSSKTVFSRAADKSGGTTITLNTAGVRVVKRQADGAIFIGGDLSSFNGISKIGIAKLGSDGLLESTYTGQISSNTILSVDLRDIQIQSDNKVVVCFTEVIASGSNTITNHIVRRLNSSGTRDTAFNITGVASTSGVINAGSTITAIALQPVPFDSTNNIEIVVVGAFTNISGNVTTRTTANRIARFNPNGTRDTAFTTANGAGANNAIFAVAVQPTDGAIVIGGDFTTFAATTGIGRVARLNNAGTLDATFDTNTGAGANGTVSAIAIQADQKIIIGGQFTTYNGVTSNRIARLNSTGTLDTDFTTNIGAGFSGTVNAIAIQPDNKILVGGSFETFNAITVNNIARLNSDGTLDTTFTNNVGTGASSTVGSIALQPDGGILLGGNFSSGPSFFTSTTVEVSGVDETFNGVYTLLTPGIIRTTGTIRYTKNSVNVASTTVTSAEAIAEYSAPAGSVVALSGATSVDSEQAFVEYATLENPLVSLIDGDILEIDTYSQEVALNGNASGNRFYLETLAEWVNLNSGSNPIELSYLENPVVKKSITNNIATIETFQDHNFRVGDSIKIQDVDNTFDGTYTITSIGDSTSFSFTKNNINVAVTDVTSLDSVVAYAGSHMVVYYRSGWLG
jgi:uncharacterized delta-60 repeat protein